MTARLPVPNSDDGTWGDVLNTFLEVGHNAAGNNVGAVIESTQAANYTLQTSDNGTRIVFNAAVTLTTPAVGTLGNGFECEIVNDSGGTVIIDGPGVTNVSLADGSVATILEVNSKQRVVWGTSTLVGAGATGATVPGFVAGPNWIQSPDNFAAGDWSIDSTTDFSTTSVVVTPGQGTAPDGTNSLSTIADNSFNGTHLAWQGGLNPPAAGVYTFSAYLKQGTARYAQLSLSEGPAALYGVIFDLQTGTAGDVTTLGTPTGTSASIAATSISGLYLATITMHFDAGGINLYPSIALSNSATPTYYYGVPTYAGSGQYIYAWDASLTTPISVGNVYVPPASPWVTAGYNINTFNVSSFSAANVDLGLTGNPGYAFYLIAGFGFGNTDPSQVTFNSDGSMNLTGNSTQGAALYSVANSLPQTTNWHGQAFGGGAYFEATFSFDPNETNSNSGANGWPAWWADPVEHAAEQAISSDNWEGQTSGYVHFVETDFFEYNVWNNGNRLFQYNGTVIDWSGIYSGGYPGFFQNNDNRTITLPVDTDFTQPHRYGFLWVPATTSTDGYFQWYFDGLPTSDRVTYGYYDPINPPSPPATSTSPWLYGVLDSQHPELIFDTQKFSSMRIYNVQVWQKDASNNIVK